MVEIGIFIGGFVLGVASLMLLRVVLYKTNRIAEKWQTKE
jgi:hypothetical protein